MIETKADVYVKSIGIDELETLMRMRLMVLREVFKIPPFADLSDLAQSNQSYYQDHLKDGSHTAVLAFERSSGRPVGSGGICYQHELPSPDNPAGISGLMMNVYVSPNLRGQGIGRQIAQYLIDDAKAHHAGRIYLESAVGATGFYRTLGFVEMNGYMMLPQPKVPDCRAVLMADQGGEYV